MLLPIIAVISTIALPIVVVLVLLLASIKSNHTERIQMIQRGIMPPTKTRRKSNPNSFIQLRNGIILVSLAIGIIVALLIIEFLGLENELMSGSTMIASIFLFLGLGFLIYFFVVKRLGGYNNEGEQDN